VNDSWVYGDDDEYGNYYDGGDDNNDVDELDDESRGYSTAKECCGGDLLDLRSHRSASRSADPLAENRDKHKLGESILYFVRKTSPQPKNVMTKRATKMFARLVRDISLRSLPPTTIR